MKILPNPNNFTPHTSFGLVQTIWVDEDFRKNRIGSKIINFIEAVFKEQNIEYYEVNYSATNQLASKFWKNCGLEVAAVTARKFLS